MTPERWRQTEDVFDAASSIPAAERDEWLRTACGNDEKLRADVDYLLEQEMQADRDGFLEQPDAPDPRLDATAEWSKSNRAASVDPSDDRHQPMTGRRDGTDRFMPKAAIAPNTGRQTADEARAVIQLRLRELPLIYVLIFGVMLFLRPVVLGASTTSVLVAVAVVATALIGLSIVLAVRRFTLGWLRSIELAITVAVASLLVLYEFLTLISRTLEEDRLFVQLIMKNVVLLTSLLMLTDGIYVPKKLPLPRLRSWRLPWRHCHWRPCWEHTCFIPTR